MVSPAMKTGLIRVGTLLSIVWVVIVGAVAFRESQDQGKLCGATDMTVSRACHQFFWDWKRPDNDDDPAAQQGEQDDKDKSIHLHIGKLKIDVQRARPLEHRFNPVHFAVGLLGPLAALWGIGFGIVWCLAGFQKKA
jgi:hypothetical protein